MAAVVLSPSLARLARLGRVLLLRAGLLVALPPVAAALALSLAALATPATLSAQGCIGLFCPPNDPPAVGLTPWGASHAFSGSTSSHALTLTVVWCDDFNLMAGTQRIELDGLDVTGQLDFQWGSSPGCGAYATSTGTVTLAQGSHTLVASIRDHNFNLGSAIGSYSYTQLIYTVAVTPDGQAVTSTAYSNRSQAFTVQNTGNTSATYDFTVTCSPPGATNCSTPGAISLVAGATGSVTVSYQTGATGSSGNVRLRATTREFTSAHDEGFINVSVSGGPAAPTVSVAEVNAGTMVERDLCLTFAIGDQAAAECGDLRLVHPLPTTWTLGKPRTPTLLYNSQHAHPYPLVAATVGLPAGAASPDEVIANLTVGGATYTSTWNGSDWQPGRANRIVVGYDALAVNRPGLGQGAGVHSYTLEVEFRYAGSTTRLAASAAGELVVVNRSNSAFGAGWWLAGLERIERVGPGTNDILWIGGDGSTRYYTRVGSLTLWRAPSVDRPDSMTFDGTYYIRHAPHGAKVKFNQLHQHVFTENRLGHVTSFSYDGQGRLERIGLPPRVGGADAHVYTFTYTAGDQGRLREVVAPATPGEPRTVTLSMTGSGAVDAIQNPDISMVRFAYDPAFAHRITGRTDQLDVTTTFGYDPGSRLTHSTIPLGGEEPAIVTRLRARESHGIAGSGVLPMAPDTALAYALLDGPRTTVGDSTRFWTDRAGAVTRVINALEEETVVSRTDSRFPALVTAVRTPTGFVTQAAYDDRGNVIRVTAVNPLAETPARDAITRYEWDGLYDFVTRVTPPEGPATAVDYDARGNRRWAQIGPDQARRVTFDYESVHGLPAAMRVPVKPGQVAVDSVVYDAVGNVERTRSPLGYWTWIIRDAVGRPTRTVSPIAPNDTVSALVADGRVEEHLEYDRMNRVRRSEQWGPVVHFSFGGAPDNTPAERMIVETAYDAAGQTRRVTRWAAPDAAGVGVITTRWGYDAAGRVVADTAPDGAVDRWRYDPAGNRERWTTRRGHVITMTYDALNRLETRSIPAVNKAPWTLGSWRFPFYQAEGEIPADVERFSYNAAGRMRTAENGDAKVAREYYPGGLLATETQRIRPWADTDWEKHVYRLRYGYDLAGRKRWVEHPQQLVVQSWADSAAYGYDPATGALSTIDDVAGNVGFRFVYDLGGRLDSLVGGDLATAYTHDLEGRAVARMQALVASPTSPIHEDLLTYDARGKVLSADTRHEIVELRYSGLGHVARSGRVSRPGMTERKNERWVTDALGNQFTAQSSGFSGLPTLDDRRYGYERGPQGVGYGRQAATYEFNQLRDTSYYDAAGNVVRLTRVTSGSVEAVASYYGADGRLRTVDRRLCATWNNCLPPGWARGAYEDYRYDALGRRVLVRARHDTLCIGSTTCLSTIQRTVWDGDQVLYEIRRRGGQGQLYAELEEDTAATPVVYSCVGICPEPRDTVASGAEHYGRVGYTHGLAMDDPLAVARIGFHTGQTTLLTIVPQRNWRGHWDGGPNFLVIDWPARRYETFLRDRNSGGPPNWMGSLINLGRDASGLQYKRNRYYDPLMGRFTQEDPIGLAGGINLYGFADGDPVNFSDPFGLCPWWVSVFGGRSNCKQFDALRPAEQAWARRHPFKARTAARLRRAAEADAAGAAQLMKRYGGAGVHNGPGDALRHATWSCRLTQEFGSETARTITDNHETVSKDHPQDPKEARMDQHNNAVGRRLGASVQSGDQCVGAAIDADRNGELQTSLEP